MPKLYPPFAESLRLLGNTGENTGQNDEKPLPHAGSSGIISYEETTETDGGPGSGRYPKGSGGNDENSYDPDGANPSIPKSTKHNLNRHFRRHGGQYPDLTKQQYHQKALELARSPVGGDIVGYKAKDGAIVRYNTSTNDFVKAYSTGVCTMYKPDDGVEYYERDKERRG